MQKEIFLNDKKSTAFFRDGLKEKVIKAKNMQQLKGKIKLT